MSTIEAPFYPIIYVRGYAGSDSEIDDTVAEPYMGFNLGATKFHQHWNGTVSRHYFESPLVRLAKDFGYTDVYSGGEEMPIGLELGPRSVFVYRYYDEQYYDALTGQGQDLHKVTGKSRSIEEFAEGLGHLILRIRERLCGDDNDAQASFRVYLVGHSMGGLVCRCLLQNPQLGADSDARRVMEQARKLVDKVFTYATPHNGIDFNLIGNVPGFFTRNDADNFNRTRMANYLGLADGTEDVSDLNGQFDPDRFFCLVGTNWQDYTAGRGWSSRLTGPMSDGLVRIINATVHGAKDGVKVRSPRAFVHRSHSGHFGIVNSEEGYQNLTRFLFGDLHVDGVLELDEITLPPDVEKAWKDGSQVRASYHFEVVVRVRGFDWDLHRRTVREESAIFRTFDDMFPKQGNPRHPHLFSTFLSRQAVVNARRRSLGFSIELGVQVPRYEVDRRWRRDRHFEGSYLFRDTVTIEATPKTDEAGDVGYSLRYGFDSSTPNRATKTVDVERSQGEYVCRIPLESKTRPGLKGNLVLRAMPWQ